MENFRLKVFRSVCEHFSFRRAAEQLHLTQPAVTQQIKALEEAWSVRAAWRVEVILAARFMKRFRFPVTVAAEMHSFCGHLW